jgi:hypothetical protein
VHPVVVSTGKASVFVDLQFDWAVHTEPMLMLSYPERPDDGVLVRDAQGIARVLPAGAVVLAMMAGVDTLELRVVSGTQRRRGLAHITTTSMGPSAADVTMAVEALLNGECKDFTGPKPVNIDCKTGRVSAEGKAGGELRSGWPRDRTPRGQFIAGLTLASVGTVSLLTGYALSAVRGTQGDKWVQQATNFQSDPSLIDETAAFQNTWKGLGTGVILTAATGSVLLVTSMPLVLPYRPKTPWWAWLSGGLGVGAAVTSIALGVTAPAGPAGISCTNDFVTTGQDAQACVDRGQRVDLAILLGTTSAPLLTMPLVYLLRRSDKKGNVELTPSVYANRGGGAFSVQGRF